MKCALIFTLFVALGNAGPLPMTLSDIFPGFVGNAKLAQPAAVLEPVKRQVSANADGELKQISFSSLIGNLENSLFESALSVHGASAPDSEVDEVKPAQVAADAGDNHGINKRSSDEPPAAATSSPLVDNKILVQTTRKVPIGEDGKPAHLIIDRVSVQPHSGGLPSIPLFQVHHTKVVSATIKEDPSSESDAKQTKISITKTSITSTAPLESPETVQSTSTSTSTSTISSSSTDVPAVSSSTTEQQPILKLKQDEEKLKEKVAEVEAEPVILTARV